MKRIIPFIFLLMISAGCVAQSDRVQRTPIPTARPTSEADIGDGGLVSQDPCGPPCLLGITPGQSSFDDVEKQLDQYGLMAACEYKSGRSTVVSLEAVESEEYNGDYPAQPSSSVHRAVYYDGGLQKSLSFV